MESIGIMFLDITNWSTLFKIPCYQIHFVHIIKLCEHNMQITRRNSIKTRGVSVKNNSNYTYTPTIHRNSNSSGKNGSSDMVAQQTRNVDLELETLKLLNK